MILLGLLFLGTSPRIDIHFDTLEGSVMDTAGSGIQGCLVARIGLDFSREWDSDSAFTDEQGRYFLEKGFPNRYTSHPEEEHVFSCEKLSNPAIYSGMDPFLLQIISPESDTVTVVFFEDSTQIWGYREWLDYFAVDTLFIDPAEVYGQPGEARVIPPIIFKSRTNGIVQTGPWTMIP